MGIVFDTLHTPLEFHNALAELPHHFGQPLPKEEQNHSTHHQQFHGAEAHECHQGITSMMHGERLLQNCSNFLSSYPKSTFARWGVKLMRPPQTHTHSLERRLRPPGNVGSTRSSPSVQQPVQRFFATCGDSPESGTYR